MGTSLKGKNSLPKGANSFLYEQFLIYSMEHHFYHIKWPPLNVTIFTTHVRNLRNGCYANEDIVVALKTMVCISAFKMHVYAVLGKRLRF